MTTGTPVYIGLRFRNEGLNLASAADDTVHFGWVRVALTAGVPGALIDYAYASTPLTVILAGATAAVPEPAAWLLMGAGLAAVAARRRRRTGL